MTYAIRTYVFVISIYLVYFNETKSVMFAFIYVRYISPLNKASKQIVQKDWYP